MGKLLMMLESEPVVGTSPLSCRRWDPHLPDHDLRHCLLHDRKVSAARFTLGKMMWKGWVVKIPSQCSWEGPGIRSRIPESVIVEQEEIAIQIGVAISYPPRRSRADGGKGTGTLWSRQSDGGFWRGQVSF